MPAIVMSLCRDTGSVHRHALLTAEATATGLSCAALTTLLTLPRAEELCLDEPR